MLFRSGELRGAHPQLSTLAGGLFEFARLELDNRHFDEALGILEEARALRPNPELLERINLLSGHAHYGAGHFEAAAQVFETVAHTTPHAAVDSLFNASIAAWPLATVETTLISASVSSVLVSSA